MGSKPLRSQTHVISTVQWFSNEMLWNSKFPLRDLSGHPTARGAEVRTMLITDHLHILGWLHEAFHLDF